MAQIPEINSSTADVKSLQNYVKLLEEGIRYAMGNLDEENITKQFIDDLTVGNILITNGDNSIIGNPEVGFQMFKGTKKILDISIIEGKFVFNGDMEGGNIKGVDIEGVNISGSSITGSTFETIGSFSRALLEQGILTLTSVINNYSAYLSDEYLRFYNGGSKQISIEGSGGSISCQAMMVNGWGVITGANIGYQSVSHATTASYAGSVSGGDSGSFESADGKTVSVSGGIITSIS